MSIFTEQEARAILDKVIKLSKADECTATLSGAESGNIRFALNNVTTSGSVSNASLGGQVAFGKRVGTASNWAATCPGARRCVMHCPYRPWPATPSLRCRPMARK